METCTSSQALQERCLSWRQSGHSIALVPTMGYFHAGHEELMRRGRALAGKLVVSLFVNPTQFGPGEDFAAYPRDAARDAAVASRLGADLLFAPTPESMYHPDHSTWVEVPDLAAGLCGLSRPTHFRGVCTVVTKLFMLVQPTVALFGEKDWQQLAIIRRMARDLSIPVDVRGVPVVREADGLALSSRNVYLTPEERAQAPHLQKGLALAAGMAAKGETAPADLARAVRAYWAAHMPLGREDYLSFVHPDSLAPATDAATPTLAAAAVRFSRARLIDNLLFA